MKVPGLIQFDEWQDDYAERVAVMRTSAVRDLFAAASRSDIISLSGGMPDIRNLPLDEVSEVAAEAVRVEGVAGLQYGNTIGREQTRRIVVELMKDFDIAITTDDVTITTGAQQALDLLGKTFINPGDTIITEGPTYVGALQAFSAYEPNIITIPFDAEGMQTDLLAAELARLVQESPDGKHGVKFLYTIPNFQNPGGVTMSAERRKRLIELSEEYDFMIVEDDPYGRLRYDGGHISPLKAHSDKVVYLGTVSKVFAPGLRTGWIVAPKCFLSRINLVKQGTDLCGSAFTMTVVEHYFTDTPWQKTLQTFIDTYRVRRDAMLAALEKYFPPEATWTKPEGGFFIWVTLPDYVDTGSMLAEALEAGVTYTPGDSFFPGASAGKNCMRIAFCFETPENLTEAIRRLSIVIEERLELYRAFLEAGAIKVHEPAN